MRNFNRYLKIIFLILGLSILTGYFAFLFAQEKTEKVYIIPQKSKEERLKNFDINTINFKDPKVIRIIPLLVEYFQCRAVVRDSIAECNNLNPWPDRVETCRKYFNDYHEFFGRLLTAGSVTPKILAICVSEFGLSREDCRPFAQAWLANDISFCEKYRGTNIKYGECIAMISGDTRLCSGDSCINKGSYVKAIKSGDIKECDKIRDPMAKSMCQGFIGTDEKICENNKGFKEFRNRYCE